MVSETTKKLTDAIMKCIRPLTYPVAVKVVTYDDDSPRPERAKTVTELLGHSVAFCQGFGLVRRFGYTLVFDEACHACPPGLVYTGYYPPDVIHEGNNAVPGYAIDKAAGAAMEAPNALIPLGKVKEFWLSPLEKAKFDPDIVVVYGNPAQIARMIHANNYSTGEGIANLAFGRAACSGYISAVYNTQKCNYVVPSGGERIFALTQDDEMIFSIPSTQFEKITEGLENTHKAGLVRYPTPYQGMKAEPGFPPYYWNIVPEERRKK